jgi:hypothetical protein
LPASNDAATRSNFIFSSSVWIKPSTSSKIGAQSSWLMGCSRLNASPRSPF